MPVLESTDRAMPRSALRHRPLESDVDQQGMTSITPVVQRASRLRSPQTEEDEQATPGSAFTGPRPKMPRLSRTGGRRRGKLRVHPLLLLPPPPRPAQGREVAMPWAVCLALRARNSLCFSLLVSA